MADAKPAATDGSTSAPAPAAPATAAAAGAPAGAESKPQVAEIRRSWGDEVDDEPEEQSSAPASTSADKAGAELDVDSLTIDEGKKINKFLDEPEDSNIKAVIHPSSARAF